MREIPKHLSLNQYGSMHIEVTGKEVVLLWEYARDRGDTLFALAEKARPLVDAFYKEFFPHQIIVPEPYSRINQMIEARTHDMKIRDWLNENAEGRWTLGYTLTADMLGQQRYGFESEKDAVLFRVCGI